MTGSKTWAEKWEYVNHLGEGGQGTTFQVKSKIDGSNAVAKVLKDSGNPRARQRMFREVANIRVVADAGGRVPKVLDSNVESFDDINIELFFVMECIDGMTLDAYVRKQNMLSLDEAVNVIMNICKTVEIAHEQDVLHRDLKPRNIVVSNNDGSITPTILDYGLSFNQSAASKSLTGTRENIWNEFLSMPETNVENGDRRDPRTEYTAICGLFYFCITGHYPELLRDGANKAPHERSGYDGNKAIATNSMCAHLKAFFDMGFAQNINERFQSLSEITTRLQAIIDKANDVPVADPKIAAIQYSEILRNRSRPVQLGEYRNAILPVLSEACDCLAKEYREPLDLFRINIDPPNLSHSSRADLKLDYDYTGVALTISIMVSHCSKTERISYEIWAEGSNAIIIRVVKAFENPQVFTMIKSNLVQVYEILKYPGRNPPTKEIIINDFKIALNESMERFAGMEE
jgi:serine/threonine protein kinase